MRKAREGTVSVAVGEAGVMKKRSGRVRQPAERAWTVRVDWALDAIVFEGCLKLLTVAAWANVAPERVTVCLNVRPGYRTRRQTRTAATDRFRVSSRQVPRLIRGRLVA